MNPEEREYLAKILEVTEENNRILKGLRRTARIGAAAKLLYWGVIIIISFGAYYAVMPYLNQLKDVYGGFGESINKINSLKDTLNGL